MKKKSVITVNAVPEIANAVAKLPPLDTVRTKIMNAKEKLMENPAIGSQVEKSKIPSYYIKRNHVTNLFVLRLDRSQRLIYTLIGNEIGITVNILDIFFDHKSYEEKFGYT